MPGKIPTIVVTFALTGFANAQTVQLVSTTTSTAPKDCRVLRGGGENDGGTRACKGPHGLAVVVSEGDLRETVSAGRTVRVAENEPAAKSWFGPFSSTTHTIEWRSVGKSRPFAMIQRWHLADIEDEGQDHRPIAKPLLVVTRLPPGKVCHVAYVDVQANADATMIWPARLPMRMPATSNAASTGCVSLGSGAAPLNWRRRTSDLRFRRRFRSQHGRQQCFLGRSRRQPRHDVVQPAVEIEQRETVNHRP